MWCHRQPNYHAILTMQTITSQEKEEDEEDEEEEEEEEEEEVHIHVGQKDSKLWMFLLISFPSWTPLFSESLPQ